MIIRLYSNKEEFHQIDFRSGLNVVIGEIHLEKDRDKDTHNLGKSTLCQLIDFCLLKRRDNSFFLFKHEHLFGDYIFYLEMQLSDGRYLTIRRGVDDASKIWLFLSEERGVNARDLGDEGWTHSRLSFDKAKTLVDGLLSFTDLQPWDYRKILPYLLRGQTDFDNVFKPAKYRSKDRDWKPFLLHVMGFDDQIFTNRYNLELEIDQLQSEQSQLSSQIASKQDGSGELDALIAIKQREINELQRFLDEFRFEPNDEKAVKELVGDLDENYVNFSDHRYELRFTINQIEKSLEKEKLLFSTEEAKSLFEEAGIFFHGQIQHSYDQLIAFNRDITDERRSYLENDLKDARKELSEVEQKLKDLDAKRSKLLSQLGSSDIIEKYKAETDDLVTKRAELETLKQQREQIRQVQVISEQIDAKKAELTRCDAKIRENINQVSDANQDGIFASLRDEFDNIVNSVIGQHGMLSVSSNKDGHAEFHAEILAKDGRSTNQDEGGTYRKLLCIAFDLALLLAHDGNGFPMFVYHDDAFGSLDRRKRENLRDVMRSCANRGVQQIVTVIDSDLPNPDFFDDEEIVLRLSDEGNNGRLFKIPEW